MTEPFLEAARAENSISFDSLLEQETELLELRAENLKLKLEAAKWKRGYYELLMAGESKRRRRRKFEAQRDEALSEEERLRSSEGDNGDLGSVGAVEDSVRQNPEIEVLPELDPQLATSDAVEDRLAPASEDSRGESTEDQLAESVESQDRAPLRRVRSGRRGLPLNPTANSARDQKFEEDHERFLGTYGSPSPNPLLRRDSFQSHQE